VFYSFAALTFAHRARCAAAMRLRPAADIVRLDFAVLAAPLLPDRFAHRAFWAALIFLRDAADKVRRGLVYNLPPFSFPKTERAASTCLSWFTRFVRSALNSATMFASPVRFAMRGIVTFWLQREPNAVHNNRIITEKLEVL